MCLEDRQLKMDRKYNQKRNYHINIYGFTNNMLATSMNRERII